MALILHINSAFETASVILSSDDEIIFEAENNVRKDHASFLEPAIKRICHAAQANLNNIDAISVVNGPGSYTGLRVSLSSAKAICYALQKPLILLNTLDVMAYALKLQSPVKQENILFCPLIDARRMEVYTGLYDYGLNLVKSYSAEVITSDFLKEERTRAIVVAGGNGSQKLQKLTQNKNLIYINRLFLSRPSVILGNKAWVDQKFSDIIYSEPFYLKQVYFKK
ncbi:MAG TPA: tRNA (adenosine(37)-N6)-threonylcarbamoyltransferase complex dimerization subunit type 1 TsaB [Parafilimonas sp.]|nr:tRNA (adenosine(37)-N6)-threonylcarbamoyltransferase complex dimerization subunit type 1 TsaB [Parafilimonas sp.]